MTAITRPVSVTVLALLYIAIGMIGFAYHFPHFHGERAFQQEDLWIELTEAVAILSGAFLLRGKNWARWLALAWMAFHVMLSIHEYPKFAIHCLFCAVIAWYFFRPGAARYFRGAPSEPM
jgi:hypothetical protein